MFEESPFPGWLETCLVPDDEFGDAYEAAMPERRAWLKTCIARLHVLHGAAGMTWGRSEKQWRQGFVSVAEARPVEWTIVFMAGDYASGPRSVAALMPALLAGVGNVLVVRVAEEGTPWAAAVLAGFELAGQEAVINLSADKVPALLDEMAGKGSGRCLVLGAVAPVVRDTIFGFVAGRSAQVACWFEPAAGSLAIAEAEEVCEIDEELLAWAHPDLQIVRYDGDNLEMAQQGAAGEGVFLALAGTPDLIDIVPDSIPLMLGPGQEGCWVWPELDTQFFMQRRLSLITEM
ncbi:MAG: hypothetical protein ACK5JO_12620 [Halodesulfovibrio sp.]